MSHIGPLISLCERLGACATLVAQCKGIVIMNAGPNGKTGFIQRGPGRNTKPEEVDLSVDHDHEWNGSVKRLLPPDGDMYAGIETLFHANEFESL